MRAASLANSKIVEMLLARGDVDVNARDDEGRTALGLAEAAGHGLVVEVLLAAGAERYDQPESEVADVGSGGAQS